MTWDDEDQDKAIAWQVYEADKCPGCGTRSHEADDYTVGVIKCRVCERVELKRAELFDTRPGRKPGRHLILRRRDGE